MRNFICVLAYFVVGAAAFLPARPAGKSGKVLSALNLKKGGSDDGISTSRRETVGNLASAAFGLGSITLFPTGSAHASGGATAGGAYLLSAKQRYNARVTAGIKGFLALSSSLEGGSLSEANAFFASTEEGGWGDLKSAGYLLSNAFRRSSTTPPDSLPSVKAWKGFQANADALQKAVDKKSSKSALAAYQKAEASLDEYLEKVELPPVIEMRQ